MPIIVAGFFLYTVYAAHAFDPESLNKLHATNSCPGCDLSGANLAGIDLYGANLSGANLTGANLAGTTFSDADLTGANLNGATINKKTNFSGAKLSNTIWVDGKTCRSGSMGRCR